MPYTVTDSYRVAQGHSIVMPNAVPISDYKSVYSFRTKVRAQDSLVLGEADVPKKASGLSGIVDYLHAEQTALRELNSEVESPSVLGEGTWGLKDAGHVFSKVHMKGGLGVNSEMYGGSELFSNSGYRVSLYVDPFTHKIWRQLSLASALSRSVQSFESYDSLMSKCSDLLWGLNPNRNKGSLGQDLVDLIELPRLVKQIPHMIGRLKDMANSLSHLKLKWDKLPSDIQHAIDAGFKNPISVPRKASSAFLEWEFVLSPYIADFKSIVAFASSLGLASIPVTRRSGKGARFRIDTKGNYDSSAWLQTNNQLSVASLAFPSYVTSSQFVNYDVLLKAKFRLRNPHSDRLSSALSSMNSKLGVIYPSLWWDLTPWTFLIDWFINIGGTIDKMYSVNGGKYVMDYCWATCKGCSGLFVEKLTPFYSGARLGSALSRASFTFFQTRVPLSPTSGIKPQFSALSSAEKLLLGALGLTHLK